VTLPSDASRTAAPRAAQILACDRDRVDRVRAGDVHAFEELFRAYKNDLGAFVASYVRSREGAEEVIQELFLHLWQQRHVWDVAVPLNIYLFRAARNRAISWLRHERVESAFRERVARAGADAFAPRQPPSSDEAARVRELEDAIDQVVSTLPERCGEVFRLNRYHHLSYAEVAEVMAISVKTVEGQMGRALATLRVRLAAWRD